MTSQTTSARTSTHPHSVDPRVLRWFRIGSTSLISFTAFESFAVGTVLPQASAQFGGTAEYSTAFGVTVAAMLIATAVSGPWIDRSGVRPVLFSGAVVFALGLVVVGLAPGMHVLSIGRAVQGLGSGLIGVVLSAMVGRLIPEPDRPRVFAMFSAAWVLPSLVGPAIAGLIADTVGWRWAFLGVAPLTLLALVATWRSTQGLDEAAFRSSNRPRNSAFLTAAFAAIALAAAQFAAPRTGGWWLVATALGLCLALAAGLRASPISTPGHLPAIRWLVITNGLMAAAFFSAEVYLPLYLVRVQTISPFAAGSVLTGAALLWAAGAYVQSRIPSDGAIRASLPVIGGVLLAASISVIAVVFAVHGPGALIFVAWSFAGFSMGLTYPTLSVLVLRLSADREQGANASALKLSESLGIGTAIACSGAVFARLLNDGGSAFAATMLVPLIVGIFLVGAAAAARRALR